MDSRLRRRVRLDGFFSRMWFMKAWRRTSLPLPVTLKRLAAPRWLFIFGTWLLRGGVGGGGRLGGRRRLGGCGGCCLVAGLGGGRPVGGFGGFGGVGGGGGGVVWRRCAAG